MSEQQAPSAAPIQPSTDVVESQETNLDTSEAGSAEETAISALDAKAPSIAEAVKEAEKSLKRKIKLKVDGEDFEDEIDLSNDDELRKHMQMSKVAQKRMSEKAQLEKEVRDFVDMLKKDPRKVLSDPSIGVDLKQLAAAIIEEEIEQSKKSPAQIEKEAIEKELKELKERLEQDKESNRRKELTRLEAQEAQRYDTLITEALNKGGLPKSPYVVKKIADYMYLGLQEGLDIGPDDVLPLVREEIQNDIKEMFSVSPDELIEQLVGNDTINRIRKKRVAQAKQAPPTPVSKAIKDTGNSSKPQESEAELAAKKQTFKSFFGV